MTAPKRRLPPETLEDYDTWGPPSSGIPLHPSLRHGGRFGRKFRTDDGTVMTVIGAWLNPRRVAITAHHGEGDRPRYFVATLIEPGQPGAMDIEIVEHTAGFVQPPSDYDAIYFDASEEPEIALFAAKAIRRMWPNGPRLVTP